MIDFLVTKLHDPHFMTMLLAAIAASATAYTLIIPFFAGESLDKRMKAVANERGRRPRKAKGGGGNRPRAPPGAGGGSSCQVRKGLAAADTEAARLQGGGGL